MQPTYYNDSENKNSDIKFGPTSVRKDDEYTTWQPSMENNLLNEDSDLKIGPTDIWDDNRDTTLQPNHKNDSINGPVVMKKDDMDMTLLLTCDNDPKDGNENTEFMPHTISISAVITSPDPTFELEVGPATAASGSLTLCSNVGHYPHFLSDDFHLHCASSN